MLSDHATTTIRYLNPPHFQSSLTQDFFFFCSLFCNAGATGFVGKTLLEKLLWSCPQLSCVYILIREKNGKPAQQRFYEFCQHKIFERLRQHYPQRLRKLRFLAGDIEKEDFGMLKSGNGM